MRKGYTITKKALDLLESSENPLKLLDEAIRILKADRLKPPIIDEKLLKPLIAEKPEPKAEAEAIEAEGEEFAPIEVEVDERFLKEYRISGSSDEFRRYFRSRYEKLSRIIRSRLSGVIDLKSALKLREGEEAYVVAMLYDKRETGKAWVLEVDDKSGEATIIVPKAGDENLRKTAEILLQDSVIGIRVCKRGESLIARDLLLPEIAQEEVGKMNLDAYVCLISDIHLGSNKFREDLFESFLDWINRTRDSEVKRIRFMIVAGDLVDGVGVYPNQHKELEITSVREQFEQLSKLFSEIPETIKIILAPGNHEPVQKALPQPPLQEEYRRILEKCGREILFVGNPAWIRIAGRKFLVYHGQGLDDVIQIIPGFSHSTLKRDIGKVLEAIIRHRHLSPIYGESTPILPLGEDMLVIDDVLNVFHVGHVHVAYAGSYRGLRLINTGTWQEQTSYQRNVGLEPTVGVASLVNLGDLSIKVKRFM